MAISSPSFGEADPLLAWAQLNSPHVVVITTARPEVYREGTARPFQVPGLIEPIRARAAALLIHCGHPSGEDQDDPPPRRCGRSTEPNRCSFSLCLCRL